MRLVRFSLLWLALSIPLALLGQQPQAPFLVKMKYVKFDLPYSSSNSCLVVFTDGEFHLEQGSDWPASKPQIFEDSLTQESLNSLTNLLAAEELKSLPKTNQDVMIGQGEIVWGLIPRGEKIQRLVFGAFEGT